MEENKTNIDQAPRLEVQLKYRQERLFFPSIYSNGPWKTAVGAEKK